MDTPISLTDPDALLRLQLDTYAAAWQSKPSHQRLPSTVWLCCYSSSRTGHTVLYHLPSRRLVCWQLRLSLEMFGRPSAAQLVEVQCALAVLVAKRFAEVERTTCLTPSPAVFDKFKDTSVITTMPLELSHRTYEFRLCLKCNATGSFRGGRCYPCRGLGREEQHGKLRSESGAAIKLLVPQGTRAVAVRPAEYVTKLPRWVTPPPMTRDNTRVLCRLATGQFVALPLDALRLDREPSTPAELVKDAAEIAATVELGDERWLTHFGV